MSQQTILYLQHLHKSDFKYILNILSKELLHSAFNLNAVSCKTCILT